MSTGSAPRDLEDLKRARDLRDDHDLAGRLEGPPDGRAGARMRHREDQPDLEASVLGCDPLGHRLSIVAGARRSIGISATSNAGFPPGRIAVSTAGSAVGAEGVDRRWSAGYPTSWCAREIDAMPAVRRSAARRPGGSARRAAAAGHQSSASRIVPARASTTFTGGKATGRSKPKMRPTSQPKRRSSA